MVARLVARLTRPDTRGGGPRRSPAQPAVARRQRGATLRRRSPAHVAAVGDAQRHRGVLLDEQDGHALAVDRRRSSRRSARPARAPAPSTARRAAAAAGAAMSARPMASICCSPPDSVPATWRDALLQPREEREHALAGRAATPPSLRVNAPIIEVLAHGQAVEDPPALRHVADAAAARRRAARDADERAPSRWIVPCARRQQSGDRLGAWSSCRAPLLPSRATISPRCHRRARRP